jgi:hypothetical protein
VLTRNTPRCIYAEAFDALEIPVEVNGGSSASPESGRWRCCSGMDDPLDGVSLWASCAAALA